MEEPAERIAALDGTRLWARGGYQRDALAEALVRRELAEIRAALGLGQWDDIAAVARARGLVVDTEHPAARPAPNALADLTTGEAALLRAITAAPGATSTGWAAELGVSPSRVRQLLGAVRQKCGVATTEALVTQVRDGLTATPAGDRK